jgi:hypothetical protein
MQAMQQAQLQQPQLLHLAREIQTLPCALLRSSLTSPVAGSVIK